jgi:phage tail-like protein
MTEETDRYNGTFRFTVSIDGIADSTVNNHFVRVSGVASESEQLTWMQGTDGSVNTAPGRVKYADITLERVYDGVDEFYEWRRKIERGDGISDGVSYRRTVTIRLMKRDNTVVRVMNLEGAWPSRWQMPDLDATSSNPAIETIVLTVKKVYEGEPTTGTE